MFTENDEQALILRDEAKYQLEQIRDIETGIDYLNKVKAIEIWLRAEKKDAELQNIVAEQKLRTQRILGKLIRDGQDAGEIASQSKGGANIPNGVLSNDTVPKTLTELGISRNQSSTFQKIAAIPEPIFEGYIAEKKAAVDNAISELTTAGILSHTDKPHVSFNSGENEWYTPSIYIESARRVMGHIDLDPASSEIANRTVMADAYYTINDDGLSLEWHGNLWINPPYSQPLISEFSDSIINNRKDYTQACILVNNATDTNWLQNIMAISNAICFVKGRIKFIDKDGVASGAPLQGQVIIYIGDNYELFVEEFNQYGICMIQAKEGL